MKISCHVATYKAFVSQKIGNIYVSRRHVGDINNIATNQDPAITLSALQDESVFYLNLSGIIQNSSWAQWWVEVMLRDLHASRVCVVLPNIFCRNTPHDVMTFILWLIFFFTTMTIKLSSHNLLIWFLWEKTPCCCCPRDCGSYLDTEKTPPIIGWRSL